MTETAEIINEAVSEEGGTKVSKKMTIILSALLWITSILMFSLTPGALKSAVHEATTEVIKIQLHPINEKLDSNSERLECLEEIQSSQVLNSGIAAYKKFEGVSFEDLPSKLESSTQNTAAIMVALRVESAREVLSQIDPERTKYFLNYFNIE